MTNAERTSAKNAVRIIGGDGEINMHSGGMFSPDDMDAVIEFMILPDDDGVLMKRTELKGENGCRNT